MPFSRFFPHCHCQTKGSETQNPWACRRLGFPGVGGDGDIGLRMRWAFLPFPSLLVFFFFFCFGVGWRGVLSERVDNFAMRFVTFRLDLFNIWPQAVDCWSTQLNSTQLNSKEEKQNKLQIREGKVGRNGRKSGHALVLGGAFHRL